MDSTESTKQSRAILFSGQTVAQRYVVRHKIGGGAFGNVYRGANRRTGRSVAIKVAATKDDIAMLENEARVYNGIRNTSSEIVGIPELRHFTKQDGTAMLVMDLLGESLHSIMQKRGRLSLKTVLMVGIQMLRRLQLIHHKGYIHRDIKPENMLIGRRDSSRIYLVDFGVSGKYRDYDTRIHMPKRNARTIIGSIPYISINAHKGTLPWQQFEIRLFPWQNPNAISESRLYRLIALQKMKTSVQTLCHSMPSQMLQFVKYVRSLQFDQRPDYAYLRTLLRQALAERGHHEDRVFDWSPGANNPNT